MVTQVMSELERWCEIDGHEWAKSSLVYCPVLGQKTWRADRKCLKCGTIESYAYIPYGTDPAMIKPIYGPILGC